MLKSYGKTLWMSMGPAPAFLQATFAPSAIPLLLESRTHLAQEPPATPELQLQLQLQTNTKTRPFLPKNKQTRTMPMPFLFSTKRKHEETPPTTETQTGARARPLRSTAHSGLLQTIAHLGSLMLRRILPIQEIDLLAKAYPLRETRNTGLKPTVRRMTKQMIHPLLHTSNLLIARSTRDHLRALSLMLLIRINIPGVTWDDDPAPRSRQGSQTVSGNETRIALSCEHGFCERLHDY